MYKIFNSSKVRFLSDCDGEKCHDGKPLPYVGWNTFENLYPRLLDEGQVSLLQENGYLEYSGGDKISLYVLDKALTKDGSRLVSNQMVQASDIMAGKYLK